jgi:hypothetical protein
MKVCFQIHVSAVLSPCVNSLSCRLDRKVGGPQGRREQCGEGLHLLALPIIEPRFLDGPAVLLL